MDSGLANRVILVTGASGGIGQAVARELAAEKARVVIHYATNEQTARAVAQEIGSGTLTVGADLTREGEVGDLFATVEAHWGPIDVLVANAGVWPPNDVPVVDMSIEQWRQTLDVDLTSVFLSIRAFFRGIRQYKLVEPAAVLVGSTAGIFGEAGHADYAAAKAALTFGLARSLKNEICRLAPRGRVNVVSPGWTRTPMTQDFGENAKRVTRALQTMPMRKIARAEDVARAVVFLASSRLSGHVNGQVLTVAGGMEGRVLYNVDEIDLSQA
jgi:3-oxoacyl-[acyl-carrier protein] reductase